MQSWQLGSIGWGCTEPVVWTTLGTTCGRCPAGLEIPVDLPMWSLVGQQDWKKSTSSYRTYSQYSSIKGGLTRINNWFFCPVVPCICVNQDCCIFSKEIAKSPSLLSSLSLNPSINWVYSHLLVLHYTMSLSKTITCKKCPPCSYMHACCRDFLLLSNAM